MVGGQALSGLAAFLVSPEACRSKSAIQQGPQVSCVHTWLRSTGGTVIMITDVQCCVLLVLRTDAWSQFIICPTWLFVIAFALQQ